VKSILKRNTPEVRVFDASLCFFALCDGAEELHTDTAFDEAGEFSLTAPLDAADDFPIDGIAVTEEGDFLIESVTRDSLAGTVTVAGRGILAFFSRRVIPHRTVYTGRAEALVLDLVSQWAPAVLPGTLSTLDYGLEETVTVDLAPGTLYSVLRSVCAAAGLGMRLRFDGGAGDFVFCARPAVPTKYFLSHSLGNLSGVTYAADHTACANRAIVLTQSGETVTVDGDPAPQDGAALREILVDARSILPTRYDTEEDYLAAVRALGLHALRGRRPVSRITPTLDADAAAVLTPGQICGVRDERLGICAEALCVGRTARFVRGGREYAAALRTGDFTV